MTCITYVHRPLAGCDFDFSPLHNCIYCVAYEIHKHLQEQMSVYLNKRVLLTLLGYLDFFAFHP